MTAATWRADYAQQPRKEKWRWPHGELALNNNEKIKMAAALWRAD